MADQLVYGSRRNRHPDGYHNTYSFDFVTPRIATGGFVLSERDALLLMSMGVTHVINCGLVRGEAYFPANFPYLSCPTRDDAGDKPPEYFQPGIVFGLEALSKPKNKLYVHCHHGQNRGPSMAYAIMRALGFQKGHAHTIIATIRPTARNFLYRKDADRAIKALGYE